MPQTYYFGRKSWYDTEEADKEIQQLKYERMTIKTIIHDILCLAGLLACVVCACAIDMGVL